LLISSFRQPDAAKPGLGRAKIAEETLAKIESPRESSLFNFRSQFFCFRGLSNTYQWNRRSVNNLGPTTWHR
jgi:hypothetical protein